MMTPNELAREDAPNQYDVVVGVPIAAHQEGFERVVAGADLIKNTLDASNTVSRAAVYLFLNYPDAHTNPDIIEASIEAARRSEVMSRYGGKTDVFAMQAPVNGLPIGGIRRILWDRAIEHQADYDNPLCLTTDIDLTRFSSSPDLEGNSFDVALDHFRTSTDEAAFAIYTLGSLIQEYETISRSNRLDIEDYLAVDALTSAFSFLDSSGIKPGGAEASYFFKQRAYRAAGGHDSSLRVGETLDLDKRMLREGMYIPTVAISVSARRHVQHLLKSGSLAGLWNPEVFAFDDRNEYRTGQGALDVYRELGAMYLYAPLEVIDKILPYSAGKMIDSVAVVKNRFKGVLRGDSDAERVTERFLDTIAHWGTNIAALSALRHSNDEDAVKGHRESFVAHISGVSRVPEDRAGEWFDRFFKTLKASDKEDVFQEIEIGRSNLSKFLTRVGPGMMIDWPDYFMQTDDLEEFKIHSKS